MCIRDRYEARARVATEEIEQMAKDQRAEMKASLVTAVRARLGEDHAGLGKIEQRIKSAPNYTTAKLIADVAIEGAVADGSRARVEGSGRPPLAPPPAAAKYNEADLIKEGIHPTMAKHIAEETNHEAAEVALKAARARLASTSSPWPTARKPAGGAS
jgi:hypothetical protein